MAATTMKAQVDELIDLAKDLGEAETDLASLEHAREASGPRTSTGASARRHLPNARRRVQWATARLASARSRFLTEHRGGS